MNSFDDKWGEWTIKSPLGVTRTVVEVAELVGMSFAVGAISASVEVVGPSAVELRDDTVTHCQINLIADVFLLH